MKKDFRSFVAKKLSRMNRIARGQSEIANDTQKSAGRRNDASISPPKLVNCINYISQLSHHLAVVILCVLYIYTYIYIYVYTHIYIYTYMIYIYMRDTMRTTNKVKQLNYHPWGHKPMLIMVIIWLYIMWGKQQWSPPMTGNGVPIPPIYGDSGDGLFLFYQH